MTGLLLVLFTLSWFWSSRRRSNSSGRLVEVHNMVPMQGLVIGPSSL